MTSKSIEDTERFARSFAELMLARTNAASVVRLVGDLGSGKTTFVKGVAKALGADATTVTSPTFIIMKSYQLSRGPWKRLVHIDAYRLDEPRDADKLKLPEIFSDPWSLVLVEWPEKLAHVLPPQAATISFTFIDENTRQIEVQ